MKLIKLLDDRREVIYLNPDNIVSIQPTEADVWGSKLIITTSEGTTTTYKSSKQTFADTAIYLLGTADYDLARAQ